MGEDRCVLNGEQALERVSPAPHRRCWCWLRWLGRWSSSAATPGPGESFRDPLRSGGHGPEMVIVPAGQFLMGDLSGDGLSRERPVHEVTIGHSFAVGKYETTFEDYQRFLGSSEPPGDEGWGRGNRPVINVSWTEAMAYVSWLSAQTGQHYRLPSEAEWEYAARAGTTTAFSWGDDVGEKPRQLRQLRQPALGRQAICARGLVSGQPMGPVRHARQHLGMGARLLERQTTTARHRMVPLGRPAIAPSESSAGAPSILGRKSPGHPIASACLRTSATVFLVSEWPARWTHPNVGSFGVCFEAELPL